jgi:energy-coupling factor transporter ATP-binding protein EcfA2
VQFQDFTISGLFGSRTHAIKFPVSAEEKSSPSVVILHGRNGIGKTTLLRMLDGVMRLDFNIFRRVPCDRCALSFDNGDRLEVLPVRESRLMHIEVRFRNLNVRLHPEQPGALIEAEVPLVEAFRQSFIKGTEDITLDFIDTERLNELQPLNEDMEDMFRRQRVLARSGSIRYGAPNPKARAIEPAQTLAARVGRFIRDAQINYRSFFSTNEPEMFPRIIERLISGEQPKYDATKLRETIEFVHEQDQQTARLGLQRDRWDYSQLIAALDTLSSRAEAGGQALTVLGTYVEQLEARAAERGLVADRLFTFERLIKSFLGDKTVFIEPRAGIRIETASGANLDERQLSSGEFHLLYLMVAALVTRRRGTVIAIDEPEMSMHIEWQRKLVPALVECASRAEPLFIFATHSPDLAASFPEALIELM